METKDNLEKFVLQNREAFDDKAPSMDLWNKLADELAKEDLQKASQRPQKMLPVRKVWQMAAGFAAVMLLGWLLQWKYLQNSAATPQDMAQSNPSLQKVAPEIAEAETYYFMQINQLQNNLKKYNSKTVGIENSEVNQELDKLDTVYQNLKKDFYSSGGQEEVVRAMIQNLQLRLQLLQQHLDVVEKAEKLKKGEVAL
jgi:hypothetical protein